MSCATCDPVKTETTDSILTLLHVLLLPALIVVGAFLDCWSARVCWAWFLATTYGDWPGTGAFLGAWFIVHILAHQSEPMRKATPSEALARTLFWTLIRPPFLVVAAWLVRWVLL